MNKGEYVLAGALLLMGLAALPALKDVYLVQSVFAAICGGLGIPVQ